MEFQSLANRVLEGGAVTREEALDLLNSPDEALMPLLEASRRLREKAFGRDVILHVLRNAKSGACPEDCNFCSQSTKYQTDVDRYRIQTVDELITGAREAYAMGATRYCMVTSTRAPSAKELKVVCEATRRIKSEMPLQICTSLGFLDGNSALELAAAGVDRFNHNLETSERHFPSVVSSHSFQDRVDTVQAAKDAGMSACCGGIIGLGETVDDRVELAFSLRSLEVESIPLNFLDPRPGTPMAETTRPTTEDCLRTLAMMRFVNPESDLRIAGGREKALGDKQGLALYPANSLFTEGYLTTGGQGYNADLEMIEAAGFRVSVVMPH